MWHLFLLRLIDNNISHHILHVDVLWKHTLSSMLSSVFVTLELVSLGCRTGPVHELKVSALLCREAGRKRFFFFSSSSFFTFSDSISRSIGICEVTCHEISPILGFQRNSILNPSEICGHITFLTSRQIMLLCDSCKGKAVLKACSGHW